MYQRVNEGRGQPVVDDTDGDQRPERHCRCVELDLRHGSHTWGSGRPAEDRERARDRLCLARKGADPEQQRAGDRHRPQVPDGLRVRRSIAGKPSEVVNKCAEQERVPTGGLVTRRGERSRLAELQPFLQEALGGQGGERRRTDEAPARRRGELDERLPVRAGVRPADADDQRHGHVVEPGAEVGQPAQRRLVTPVRVVDHQGEWAPLGGV